MAGQVLGSLITQAKLKPAEKLGNPQLLLSVFFFGFVEDTRQTCLLLLRYVPLSLRNRR